MHLIYNVLFKVARGNNNNGGELPENGGDELLLYYNTDESLNFPSSGFMGTLVPIPPHLKLHQIMMVQDQVTIQPTGILIVLIFLKQQK